MTLNLRVSDVVRDKEYLSLYKKSGIVIVDLGVEATEQQLLNEFRKGTTIHENKQAIAYLKKHDIMTIVNLLVGGRHETKSSLNMKFKTVSEWDPDLLLPYILTPYPWTPFYEKNKAWIRDWDYEDWNYVHPVIEMEKYDDSEFIDDILDNIFKFHLRKYLFTPFIVKDKYRRNSMEGFILKTAIHYFYQRHRFFRPIMKGLFVREPTMINLYGKGV
jgi:anaerobic magnesium-protoporphyrin IX monomethyl ester cyclase